MPPASPPAPAAAAAPRPPRPIRCRARRRRRTARRRRRPRRRRTSSARRLCPARGRPAGAARRERLPKISPTAAAPRPDTPARCGRFRRTGNTRRRSRRRRRRARRVPRVCPARTPSRRAPFRRSGSSSWFWTPSPSFWPPRPWARSTGVRSRRRRSTSSVANPWMKNQRRTFRRRGLSRRTANTAATGFPCRSPSFRRSPGSCVRA